MIRAVKRTFIWSFLTVIWGFLPGAFLYYLLWVTHDARVTSLIWGLTLLLILGSGAALSALDHMEQPNKNSKNAIMATSAVLILDILIICLGYALVRIDDYD